MGKGAEGGEVRRRRTLPVLERDLVTEPFEELLELRADLTILKKLILRRLASALIEHTKLEAFDHLSMAGEGGEGERIEGEAKRRAYEAHLHGEQLILDLVALDLLERDARELGILLLERLEQVLRREFVLLLNGDLDAHIALARAR